MKLKRFLLFAFLVTSFNYLQSQNYHKDYQDGIVVFQLKVNEKPLLSEDYLVDFKKYNLFTEYLQEFNIVEVKHLLPFLKDKALYRTYQIQLSEMAAVDEVIRKLSKHEMIEYAELKELHHSFYNPNDYNATQQWSLLKVQAPQAWDISTGDANVIVAVTDNAILTTHPDLQNILTPGWDATNNTANPNPCGGNNGSHGTHVSGTVGAETDNGIGVASIGFGVSVMPVKIGRCSDGALTAGYEGIAWAANNGAHVINMSWGGAGASQYGQNVVNNAWNSGSILVAAAGNDNVTSVFYPANYNNVISVASTDNSDNKSSFSNYGSWIDISAPGSSIRSTLETGGYGLKSGTSMASPMVSGLLGLMKSYGVAATNTDIINCLYSSADPLNGAPYANGQMGAGRINAFNALNCMASFNNNYDMAITKIVSPIQSICASSFTPQIELRNFGAQTLTSCIITYDWGGATHTYNWTGSLATTQTALVTLPTQTVADGAYTFTATVSSPNGQQDENTFNDTATSQFIINSNGTMVTLKLDTDCWGSETTWEIVDDNTGITVATGGSYADAGGGQSISEVLCLAPGCYTFGIFDAYGDGMNGSQYSSCSVDGYYELLDSNGDPLFTMTAPSANFGAQAYHPFCLNNFANDAGIMSISSPLEMICTASANPIVKLKNYGANALTAVTIQYRIGTGNWQSYSWTGNLGPSQSQMVTLPNVTFSAGTQAFSVRTSAPNNAPDANIINDQAVINVTLLGSAVYLPFVEDFETAGIPDWTIENPDNGITWAEATIGGNSPGNRAMKLDFFNYSSSNRRDGLISPRLNLVGMIDAQLDFEHAFRRYDQSSSDSLIIYVSTDCGATWNRVFGEAENGTGNFATQTTTTTAFTPAAANDWCLQPISAQTPGASCFTVNLNQYVGYEIFVKFESYNSGNTGNNLYIDNINIIGTPAGDPPIPALSTNNNIVCVGDTVHFSDASSESPTSWNWTFQGGSPSTSTAQNPVVTYANSGTYNVTLEVANIYGSQVMTFTNEIIVGNPPQINITLADSVVCEGSQTLINASGATSYNWDNGLGSGSGHYISPTTTTTYTVEGTANGCTTTESVTVIVSPLPNVQISTPNIDICKGDATWLYGNGANTYQWNSGLGTADSVSVSPNSDKSYILTGTDINGCSNKDTIKVFVHNRPNVYVSGSSQQICEGDSVTLVATGADNLIWNNNLGTNGTIIVTPTTSTMYSVTGYAYTCSDSDSILITVNPYPATPVITQTGNVLSVILQPGETAEWFLDGVSIGTGDQINVSADGEYTVEVSSAAGCISSESGKYGVTGLNENSLNEQLSIYPNPTRNELNIVLQGGEKMNKISVFDALGKEIKQMEAVKGNAYTLNMQNMANGVYMIRVETNNQVISRKVIKR